jgi:acetoacetyl-CoA synthetase
MPEPLWVPDPERVERAQITRFRRGLEASHGLDLRDYVRLHRWSVEHLEAFWTAVWDFCELRGARTGPALVDAQHMPGARFFPEARLSFAENLLWREGDSDALIFRGEDGARRTLSWSELRAQVGSLSRGLDELGVRPGDRVAAYLPCCIEAVVAMLACATLGAIWSSCSPDFGTRGVLDRFSQITPRVLFGADGYRYAGRVFPLRDKLQEIRRELDSIEHVIAVPFLGEEPASDSIPWESLVHDGNGAPRFECWPFSQPLYVLYSSGTTGQPKCIVHGAGGTLLQHAKEHRLHTDLGAGDRFFYFTTCGWMMWNWLASGLAAGATLVLYDGSPFHPGPEALFDLADAERVTVFGTSAKFIDAVAKSGIYPRASHDLASVRSILSTGSPLAPQSFEFVYAHIKSDVCLSSISGGTDLIGCFAAGHPAAPVYAGEAQVLALGMDVAALDEHGDAVRAARGELVCRRPFPSMPVGFWNDPGHTRYRAAYFERYPGVWHHGDFIEITERGGMVIYGRSDAVLNPGGVRIGTAEIYRPVERIDEVEEALVIGQEWGDDVRVVLFVRLRSGVQLDADLCERIRDGVRREASPRHVPAHIIQVPDIPRTRSGKIVELAVRDVVHGHPVNNVEALANPEALEHFRDLEELRS